MKSFQLPLEDIPAADVHIPPHYKWPLVLSSPHSGRAYPTCFIEESRLNHATLRRSEDFCVDYLFDFAPELDLPIIKAEFPRCYVDTNRSAAELDPVLFADVSPTSGRNLSRRVANGLGVIPRVVGAGLEIYDDRLSIDDARDRLARFHTPYHKQLSELVDAAGAHFSQVLLLDCHSMPDSAASRRIGSGRSSDMVIGDLHGRACASEIAQTAVAILSSYGYRVTRNDPYAGGYTTQVHGRPHLGRHCLQLEINRKLYMDERRLKLLPSHQKLKSNLKDFIQKMSLLMAQQQSSDVDAIAAE
ncbi:MAG: N-formylglutamate amidohydrolase [Pseudomonadota bacterium]